LTLACKLFEKLVPGSLCSIQLLDKTRTRIRNGAAPSLPTAFTDALQDKPIGPAAGSCGTAIYKREPVLVVDIATSPLWVDYASYALAHGLASCWSIPLLDGTREPLGSFAVYHRAPHYPTQQETEVVHLFSNAVAVAIERRREHELLIAAKVEAVAANRSKTEFLAHMSHELRTPLNAIIGFSDAMLSEIFGPLGSDRYVEYTHAIHSSGTLLLSMIDGLLDLSRLESGGLELHEGIFDVATLIDECVRVVSLPAISAKVNLTVDKGTPGLALIGDRRAIARVILNVLGNAIKFTPEGGTIALSVVHEDNFLSIDVTDTGIGIEEQDLAKVGQPFASLRSRTASVTMEPD
jgi:signal transduction histidine kinase